MDATINKERDELFNALCRKKGNRLCFDCNTPNPKWTSKNYCVFVCLDCSGIHRSLGVHISRVKSANMDRWSRDELDVFKASGGNDAARAFFSQHGWNSNERGEIRSDLFFVFDVFSSSTFVLRASASSSDLMVVIRERRPSLDHRSLLY